jgi:hypothetical protein
MKRPFRQETRTAEGALPLRSSSGISPRGGYQKQNGVIINKKMTRQKQKLGKRLRLKGFKRGNSIINFLRDFLLPFY